MIMDNIDDIRFLWQSAIYVMIVLCTIVIFNIVSKKEKKLSRLILKIIIPVWIIAAILLGIEKVVIDKSNEILYLPNFPFLLAEILAPLILFGGITFYAKYKKLKKN